MDENKNENYRQHFKLFQNMDQHIFLNCNHISDISSQDISSQDISSQDISSPVVVDYSHNDRIPVLSCGLNLCKSVPNRTLHFSNCTPEKEFSGALQGASSEIHQEIRKAIKEKNLQDASSFCHQQNDRKSCGLTIPPIIRVADDCIYESNFTKLKFTNDPQE